MVYLIHFNTRLAHAQHYMGSTDSLKRRLAEHASGNGSRLMQVIGQAGITWQLARTWDGGRTMERKLKRQKHGPRLCPICRKESERICLENKPNTNT